MPDYPGLGLPLRHDPHSEEFYPLGMHGNCYGSKSDILPVREVAMMFIMDKLTDKPNWQKKVFDDEIVAKWRKEALEYPDDSLWKQATGGKLHRQWADSDDFRADDDLARFRIKSLTGIVSNEAFDYCVEELRSKARYYEKSGLIPTIDACASVIKSDTLISTDLQVELRHAFDKLKEDQKESPDWHPHSRDMVQDLLHPSMYPLVYGQSRVLKDEVVGVNDAINKWAGKGEVIIEKVHVPEPNPYLSYAIGGSSVPTNFWSNTYQWLPSNVAFQNDGSVRFTSYINNLHPNKYPDIYRTIEKLIQKALPAWDQCLTVALRWEKKTGAGRIESRFSKPEDASDEIPENWDPSAPEAVVSLEPEAVAKVEVDSEDDKDSIDLEEEESDNESEDEFDNEADREWHRLRKPVQPQPDPFNSGDDYYTVKDGLRLSERFKESGLQIIVKMASIELTPEKSEFPAGGWHVEGQMNERICATALYYLDSENISSSDLSFRMQTSAYLNDDIEVGQDAYHWLEQVYGTGLGGGNFPCLQNYGSVETREGRLLAFPNVFQHRVSPFRLVDSTKPGHRRFIALWLVDPHVRIISTANVPPQQQHWWAESIFSNNNETKAANISKLPAEVVQLLQEKGVATGASKNDDGKLPVELMRAVRKHFDAGSNTLLMAKAEAEKHRESLMEVRSAFHSTADKNWQQHSYSFCEH